MMSAVAAGSNHAAPSKRPGKDRAGNKSAQSSSNTHTVKHDNKQDSTPTTGKTAQPTPEQVRLAQMVADKKDTAEESDFNQKIHRLVELTGRSKDEVAVALHDSENDADRAAYLLLEEGVTLDQGEWRETGKKKKKNTQPANQKNDGTTVNHSGDAKTEKSDQQRGPDREFNNDKTDNSSMPPRRQRRNDTRPPRLTRGRGRDKAGNIGDRENDDGNWNNEDNRSGGGFRDRGRGRGRGGPSRGGRGGPRERAERRTFGTERFDNNRFDNNNQFQTSRFDSNITQFESSAPFDKGPQIDTWTNETAEVATKEESWDIQTEDWNDDVVDTWTGGLAETTVFEAKPQPVSLNHEASVAMIADANVSMPQQNSLPQRIDLTTLLQPKSPGPPHQNDASGPSPESQFISQYNKEATESIKNTIGIGSGNRQGPLPHGLPPQAVNNAVDQLTAVLAVGGVSPSAIMSQHAVSQNAMHQQVLSQNAMLSQQASATAAAQNAALLSQHAASQNAMLNQQSQQQVVSQNTLMSQQAAAQNAMLAQQTQNAMLSQQGIARMSASQGVSMPGQSSSVQPVLHQRPKPVRSKLPPPSKIPAMAVEMPGHQMAGSLDVQFGNLEFGVDSFGFVAPETAVSNNYNTMSTVVDASSAVVTGNLASHLEQVTVAQVNGAVDVSAVASAALAASSTAMISPPPGSQSTAQAPMAGLDQTPPRSVGSASSGSAASTLFQSAAYNVGSPQKDMSVSQTMSSIGQTPQQISSPELIPFPPNSQTEKKSSPLGNRSGQAPSLAQASYSNQADASTLAGFTDRPASYQATDRTASYQSSAYKSSGVPSQSYGHSSASLSQTGQYQGSLNSQNVQSQNLPQALPKALPQAGQYPNNLSSPTNQFSSSGQNQYQSSSSSQQNHYSSGTSSSSQAQFSTSPTAQSQYPSNSSQYPSNSSKFQSGQNQYQSGQNQFAAASTNPYQSSSNQYQPVQYQSSQTQYQSSNSTSPYQSSQNQYSANQNNYPSGQIPYQTYQSGSAFQSQSGYSSQPSSNSLYQSSSNSAGAYQGSQSASSGTGYPGGQSTGSTTGSFSGSQNSADSSSYHSSVRDTQAASGSYHSSSVNQSASSYQRDSQSQSQPGSYAGLQTSQIASNKLGDSLSKLTVKDTVSPDTTSQQQGGSHSVHSYEHSSPTTYTSASTTSASSLTTAASTTSSSLTSVTSNMATSVISSTVSSMSGSSSSSAKSSSSIPSTKGQSSFPPGVNVPLVNPQYIMSQGGMAPFFGLPQQALNVYAGYDAEVQLLQQRLALNSYYDLNVANSPAMPTLSGRADQTVALGSVPYADGKVSRVEVQSPVPPSQTPQQSQSTHQQPFINPAPAIPPGYSYYTYPSMLHSASFQYPPNFFMPPVTNTAAAAHAGSSIAAAGGTQYQKAYGSHTYGTSKGYDDMTAQPHDYSKTAYGAAAAAAAAAAGVQSQNKGGGSAASLSSATTAAELSAAGYGGKSHPQGYDKQGFHGATATSYNQLLGNQAAAQMGAPTTPFHPFVSIMPHQQHSQILHHQLQDPTSGSSRINHQSASQAKAAVAQKTYSGQYWSAN